MFCKVLSALCIVSCCFSQTMSSESLSDRSLSGVISFGVISASVNICTGCSDAWAIASNPTWFWIVSNSSLSGKCAVVWKWCVWHIACLETGSLTSTLNSVYNEKKYVEILLRYRQLFVKDDVLIGEWGIFGAEVFLCYSCFFFVKGNFIIGGVECIDIKNRINKGSLQKLLFP